MQVFSTRKMNYKLPQHIVHPGTNTMSPYPKSIFLGWLNKPGSIKMITSTPSKIYINRGCILGINLEIKSDFFDKYQLEISHNGAENLYEDIFQVNDGYKYRIIWDTFKNDQNNYRFRFTERNIEKITNEYYIDVDLLNGASNVEEDEILDMKYFYWNDLKTFPISNYGKHLR